MFKFTLNKLLQKAKIGEEKAREELISVHRDYITRVSSRICKRFLSWENDDELSIALMAFNEAIDSYDAKHHTSFLSFAYTVIQRRLTDYFRKNQLNRELPLLLDSDYLEDSSASMIKQSQTVFQEQQHQENMAEVIEIYREGLTQYNITLKDLVNCSPKHRDTRENLMLVAQTIVHNQDFLEYLHKHKKLPMRHLLELTGLSQRVLENGRKYIISLVIILVDPNLILLKRFSRFPYLKEIER